jgi:hypothetical protein
MMLYDITISPEESNHEYRVLLRGPGIEGNGKRFVFRNTQRCTTFLDAVNFAYQQGLRDGRRDAQSFNTDVYLITGTTPDNMIIRRESFWERVKRRWLGFA